VAGQLNRFTKNITDIVDSLIEVIKGRQNNVGTFSLAPSTTLTVVQFVNCSKGSNVSLTARTANAAAALATTYISSVDQGSFTVTHLIAGSGDRTFGFEVTGGG